LGTRIPAPKSVKIELTARCNYRCKFCALATRENQPRKDMDRELYSRIVREMAAAGVKEIGAFYIGESFLNVDLLEFAIKEAHDAGIPYVFLTTNGSIATPEAVERVMKAGLNSLKFSMTTADDEQFEQVIGAPATMRHKAIEHLKAARAIRDAGNYNCGIYASSIKYDDEQLALAEKLADEIKPHVDEHYWLPLYSFGSLATEQQAKHGLDKPTPGNMGRVGALRAPLPCWCVFTEGHVLYDGRLTLCGFDNGRGDWVCGDLKTESFMDAWNSETARKLRAAHLRRDVTGTACETCAAY
jgi:MoaA/NifB/PqqE/SkfB family radical SAM enzyme